ncbi:hypothetical protein NQ315_013159 [Exocentrus adspersus]|uniref:Chromatin modification-related protein YNG2 n=1 Tax=Exocentrus adspersus TaxID=1586481 RepID=A0AAV8VXQ9_9CUCU|nr:hypothetical protein NQ315_013159 [Exocentrus adspersus]
MEDGSNTTAADVEVLDCAKNGVVTPMMANFPDGTTGASKDEKINHIENLNGVNISENNLFEDNSCSSESDVLVIDESIPKRRTSKKKSVQRTKPAAEDDSCNRDVEVVTHSNPYFNESLFELSQLHQNTQDDTNDVNINSADTPLDKDSNAKHKKANVKAKPKLREYAQYLGLQPTVQFKCSKCGRAGFESLITLHDHIIHCNSVQTIEETTPENSCSGFKLTRKVFLCSACGTYYENWNLYMHMLEFHRRYICLYCLGMFSVLEDLCQHIQSRHNLEPGHKDTLDEFFNVYNEPCYVVCCECNKLFNERDNFFYHSCVSNKASKAKKPTKQPITPENHVTGDSVQLTEMVPGHVDRTSEEQNIEDISDKNSRGVEHGHDDVVSMETRDNLEDCKSMEGTDFDKQDKEIEDINNRVNNPDASNCDPSEDKSNTDLEENKDNDRRSSSCSDTAKNIQEECTSNLTNEDVFSDSEKKSVKSMQKAEESLSPDLAQDSAMETNASDGPAVETRKVPKLSLKLSKIGSYAKPEIVAEDSDDSEKLTMEVDQIESENENDEPSKVVSERDTETQAETPTKEENVDSSLQVAGSDISIIELQLEQPLDKFDPRVLLQKCLKATVPSCIYCNHARKIAVNGKQLGLHCIAEHRFSAVVNSITAEELIPESFINRIKESLDDLEAVFFNLESSFSDEGVTYSHTFECFQCRFVTTVHKELYLHNRKFHSKNLLLCIMCKSNFYSYSELICHLCPGVYILDYDPQFRCCMCVNDDLPSSFRLMVHLRKRHNVCDVCLEMCHTQYRLSNHVWKHKLHHFCYRCGIAYRNKPDITRHLFWKHGTESVLCKKCLQKKWPHVYHFCVPPSSFICEECNLSFSKAVSLKVHKRIHTDEKKHACTFEGCTEKFISKKLMLKHELRHTEPPEEDKKEDEAEKVVEEVKEENVEEKQPETVNEEDKVEEKRKPKMDVLDLPELNLSESDTSDSEDESDKKDVEKVETGEPPSKTIDEETAEKVVDNKLESNELCTNDSKVESHEEKDTNEESDNPNSVIQNIWNNFKNYQASKEKMDNMFSEIDKPEESSDASVLITDTLTTEVALRDHDYCVDPEKPVDTSIIEVKPALMMTESVDHDYCSPKTQATPTEKPTPETVSEEKNKGDVKEKKNSDSSANDSSSDSDSSNCSCGSNCSCSSSSDSSSSTSESSNSDSSTEEGRKKQQIRRQRRKERAKKMSSKQKGNENDTKIDVVTTDIPQVTVETPIRESDLETTESETDEEFYDRAPQKLAKKLLEEKRQQLLAIMGPFDLPSGNFIESTSRPPTPPIGIDEEESKPKKKSKSKKRKKRKSDRKSEAAHSNVKSYESGTPINLQQSYYQYQQPAVASAALSVSQNSLNSSQSATAPFAPTSYPKVQNELGFKQESSDFGLRASKRRRVPNKFYGYSSDEEQDKVSSSIPKWRKIEVPQTPAPPMVVPPITIKTSQPAPQPTVEPISIRTGTHLSDFRVQRPRPKPNAPHKKHLEKDSATESNDSSSEEQQTLPKPNQPQLYCYCRCPYDEVSEMIGCDASDCAIEWFHFECVGIMVPPKGQWFCPDCRKKKQQRRELLQT